MLRDRLDDFNAFEKAVHFFPCDQKAHMLLCTTLKHVVPYCGTKQPNLQLPVFNDLSTIHHRRSLRSLVKLGRRMEITGPKTRLPSSGPLRAGAFVLACPSVSQAAFSADLTGTAFGGTWEKAYRKCFAEPFEKRAGKTIDVTLGNPLQWVSQVAANPAKSPIDVMVSTPEAPHIAIERKLLDELASAQASHASSTRLSTPRRTPRAPATRRSNRASQPSTNQSG
ncbi:hypothetical protein [Burkholderia ubonensis]|uniref:hypothetical protein n=1 Tax=Burkholderia ubonensis TaxID=101571 RepID=UPI0012FCE7F4|nr:hypothetical protein [Burkholderia ubonensis]